LLLPAITTPGYWGEDNRDFLKRMINKPPFYRPAGYYRTTFLLIVLFPGTTPQTGKTTACPCRKNKQ
jgi:hypothetical protein